MLFDLLLLLHILYFSLHFIPLTRLQRYYRTSRQKSTLSSRRNFCSLRRLPLSPHARVFLNMPTPSAPDPQTQYSFPTCPDTDESSRQHNSNTGLVTHTIYPPATVPEDSISPRSTALSPGSQFDSSDGPVSDTDVDTSHPVRGDRAYIESHKITEIEVNRTDSPCNSSPTDSIAAATPRHGVGTNYHMDLDAPENSQYQQQVEYEAEEDFALPCMGYAYPSRRVCPSNFRPRWSLETTS